jgi:hypothetical protein
MMAAAIRIHLIQPSMSARDTHSSARVCARVLASSPKCASVTLADRQISISLMIFTRPLSVRS